MIKRFLDIFISVALLILIAPVILLAAYLIRQKLGSPVLFRQIRPGLDGKPFENPPVSTKFQNFGMFLKAI